VEMKGYCLHGHVRRIAGGRLAKRTLNEGRENRMRYRNRTKKSKEIHRKEVMIKMMNVQILSSLIEKNGKFFYKTFLDFRKKHGF